MSKQPWHGVVVASALPFNADLSVDYDAFADHVRWLAENGCHGITPNGSLGEYQCLTPEERAKVVEVSVEPRPRASLSSQVPAPTVRPRRPHGHVRPSRPAPMHCSRCLPTPIAPMTTPWSGALRRGTSPGLPIIAYNNPHDTKVDMSPALLARMHAAGLIAAVKEFSGDVRRIYEIQELAPDLEVLVGTDDVVLELALAGAKGWIAGYPNALPAASVQLWELSVAKDLDKALPMYQDLHALLRWDSKPAFVQAIKLSMDVAGRKGGACRPPRRPLPADVAASVTKDTEKALAHGYR